MAAYGIGDWSRREAPAACPGGDAPPAAQSSRPEPGSAGGVAGRPPLPSGLRCRAASRPGRAAGREAGPGGGTERPAGGEEVAAGGTGRAAPRRSAGDVREGERPLPASPGPWRAPVGARELGAAGPGGRCPPARLGSPRQPGPLSGPSRPLAPASGELAGRGSLPAAPCPLPPAGRCCGAALLAPGAPPLLGRGEGGSQHRGSFARSQVAALSAVSRFAQGGCGQSSPVS